MPGHRVRPFAVEAEQAAFRYVMTIRGVGKVQETRGVEDGQHGALLIGDEQARLRCAVLTPLLRQQLIFMLHDRVL